MHEQLAAGKGGWRGRHGYYMPAPADRLVRACSPYMPLAHGVAPNPFDPWVVVAVPCPSSALDVSITSY